jgi:hypothetical protein
MAVFFTMETIMALTHTAIKNAKPNNKVYKLFDGGGALLVS